VNHLHARAVDASDTVVVNCDVTGSSDCHALNSIAF
jgi:hypothetical protein